MKVLENMATTASYAGNERRPPTQLQDATSIERQSWPVSLANSSDPVKADPND